MQEPLIEQVPIENEINTSTNRNLYNTNIRNQQNNYGPYQNQYNNNQNQYQNNQYQNQYQNQYNNNQYQNNQMQYQRQNNQNQYQNNQYQNQYNQNQYPNQNQYQNNQYQKPNQNQYQNNQYQNNQYQNNQYQNNQYQNNQMQYQNNPNQYQNNQYRPPNNQMQYQNNQNQSNQVQYQNNQYQNQNQNMQVQYQNINNQNQFQNNQIQYQNQNNLINSYQNNQPENLDINLNGQNLTGNPLWNPYVQSEIQKVNSQQNLSTRIINVTKTFYPCCSCCGCCRKNKVRAINHLHLGLEENEKFGLLGFNGSGKTTTFRAITNEIMTDFGTINIFGHDTKKHFNSLRNMIGYCPQDNPLFDFSEKMPLKVRALRFFDLINDLYYLSSKRNRYYNDSGIEILVFHRAIMIFCLIFSHTFTSLIRLPSEEIINSSFFKSWLNILFRLSNNGFTCWIFLEAAYTTYKLLFFITTEMFLHYCKPEFQRMNYELKLLLIFLKFIVLLLPKFFFFFFIYYFIYYRIEDFEFTSNSPATFRYVFMNLFKEKITCGKLGTLGEDMFNSNTIHNITSYDKCYEFSYFYINMIICLIII